MGSLFLKSIPQGAATTVFCCVSDSAVPGAYHYDCARHTPTHTGDSDEAAQQLWKLSEVLLQNCESGAQQQQQQQQVLPPPPPQEQSCVSATGESGASAAGASGDA